MRTAISACILAGMPRAPSPRARTGRRARRRLVRRPARHPVRPPRTPSPAPPPSPRPTRCASHEQVGLSNSLGFALYENFKDIFAVDGRTQPWKRGGAET